MTTVSTVPLIVESELNFIANTLPSLLKKDERYLGDQQQLVLEQYHKLNNW